MRGEGRLIGLPLMTGLVAVPALFVWFLFLPGYRRSTRRAALVYAFGPAALGLAAAVTDAATRR